MTAYRRYLHQVDWSLLGIALLIAGLGLIVLYSAGHSPESHRFFPWIPLELHSSTFGKQGCYLLVGLLVLGLGAALPQQMLSRYALLVYLLALMLLEAVHFFGVVSNGSRRWLALGSMRLQPSEVVKICLILALAKYISRNPPQPGGYRFRDLIVPLLMVGLPMISVLRQPDLGTALTIGAIGFSMILFTGIRVRALLILALSLGVAGVEAWSFLAPYQQRRVLTLVNPDADPLGSGYHVTQSKIAVGSGMLFGKGFLQGTQTRLEFLPEHTTDFVFSVLAEEWGFFGCTVLLFLYFLFISRIFRVALRSRDLFGTLVAFGAGVMVFVHVTVNIGMVVGVLPVVGIPLPLLSYGGSSMITTLFSLGLVLGVSMRRLNW